MFKRSGLMALAVLCGLAAGEAQAQCGGFYGGGLGYYDMGRLYQVLSENVPYYAAFPPVYYSIPVPRTYGYSPFAYPPGTMTPEVLETVSAQEIVNPYVAPASADQPAEEADKVTQSKHFEKALVVVNPHLPSRVAQATIVSHGL